MTECASHACCFFHDLVEFVAALALEHRLQAYNQWAECTEPKKLTLYCRRWQVLQTRNKILKFTAFDALLTPVKISRRRTSSKLKNTSPHSHTHGSIFLFPYLGGPLTVQEGWLDDISDPSSLDFCGSSGLTPLDLDSFLSKTSKQRHD